MIRKTKLFSFSLLALAMQSAYATNGMNLSGYGPISSGLGGGSQAYNIGLGGMLENPATLTLGEKDGRVFEIGLGNLGPSIDNKYGSTVEQKSSGDGYLMPGGGVTFKNGVNAYGFGVFGQGGMGTEYDKAKPGSLFYGGTSMMGANTLLSGEEIRSELSVGRLMGFFNREIDEKLTIGATLDYVWGGMDLEMDVSGSQFGSLDASGNVSGSMFTSLQTMIRDDQVTDVNWARFQFTDSSPFTEVAQGFGVSGKIGMVYKVSPQLTFGASYNAKTNMSDMTSGATMSMSVETPGGTQVMPLSGDIRIVDFQWPSSMKFGVAYKASDRLTLVADYKRINWSEVMDSFRMNFVADGSASNGSFANQEIDVTMPQNWQDQTVTTIGANYWYKDNLELRAGMNIASNPVPSDNINPLFPATIERHYNFGFSYHIDEGSKFSASYVIAPEVKVVGTGDLNNGVETTHSQQNWELSYTSRF